MKRLTFTLLICISASLLSCTNQNSNSNKIPPSSSRPKVVEKQPLRYIVSETNDVSYSNVKRMVYRIVMQSDTIPSDNNIRLLSKYIWKNGNTKWNEFTVLSYMPGMNTGRLPYGRAEFKPSGLIEFETNDMAFWDTKWQKK